MRYLLDTNILSVMARDPLGPLAKRLDGVGSEFVCTSIIVAAELRFWLAKGASKRLWERVQSFLERIEVLPFDAPADAAYGKIRSELERSGTLIGANDMFIAAHGLALGHTIVTDNVREFSRVEGLLVENWRRA